MPCTCLDAVVGVPEQPLAVGAQPRRPLEPRQPLARPVDDPALVVLEERRLAVHQRRDGACRHRLQQRRAATELHATSAAAITAPAASGNP